MIILIYTDHNSWHTYKKIMKLNLNETRETRQQPKASQTNKPTMNNEQHTKTKRKKTKEMHIPPRRMEIKREEKLPRPWIDM